MNNTNAHSIPYAESEPASQTTIRVKHGGAGEGNRLMQPANVHPVERLASLIIGGGLLLWIGRRFVAVVSLTALAAYLLYRGVSGRCFLYEAAAIDTTNGKEGVFGAASNRGGSPRSTRPRDKVDQSSWESFPASDPPAMSTPTS